LSDKTNTNRNDTDKILIEVIYSRRKISDFVLMMGKAIEK